jgi:hypothetical protein
MSLAVFEMLDCAFSHWISGTGTWSTRVAMARGMLLRDSGSLQVFVVVPIKMECAAGPKTPNVAASPCDWACVLGAADVQRLARFAVAQGCRHRGGICATGWEVVQWAICAGPTRRWLQGLAGVGSRWHQQLQRRVDEAIVRSPTL